MSSNPYAPPKAFVADVPTQEESPPLWNPYAAANWSLLFSPAFGAFLHMKNCGLEIAYALAVGFMAFLAMSRAGIQ